MITDTHFSIRGRLGRLVAGLRDTGMRWGIGVDENTALFLHSGQGTVRGEHGVFIVDTASATFSPVGEPFRARDVRVSLLTSGDSWNPADGAIVSSKPRVAPTRETVAASDDIFSAKRTSDDERANPYATTIVMRELINSRATSVDARAHPAGSFVFVRFRKTNETWGGWASPSSFTVVSMHMDIDRKLFYRLGYFFGIPGKKRSRSKNETFTRPMRAGTSTRGPMTAAKAAPWLIAGCRWNISAPCREPAKYSVFYRILFISHAAGVAVFSLASGPVRT